MIYLPPDQMFLGGGMESNVRIVLRNPLNHADQLDYVIQSFDHKLGQDWISALEKLLQSDKPLEKNYCFLGFPHTPRTVEYLCNEITQHITTVNNGLDGYYIDLAITPDTVLATDWSENGPNHILFNELHNHFEILQGTVSDISNWYKHADYDVKYAIRQLNNICHELESLILSRRKAVTSPDWIRPSQITTWITADRYTLTDEHRQLFKSNGYNRVLGGVYMHWTQIGKTLFEVFRDEHAPVLTNTVCDAITHLKYYSGEFDVEWGNDIVYNSACPWHDEEQDQFCSWLQNNGQDITDVSLSLGYLPLGQVQLQQSFGTTDSQSIWSMLSAHLDIYKIEVNGTNQVFNYCWNDSDYKQQQIAKLKPGYDYQRRMG